MDSKAMRVWALCTKAIIDVLETMGIRWADADVRENADDSFGPQQAHLYTPRARKTFGTLSSEASGRE